MIKPTRRGFLSRVLAVSPAILAPQIMPGGIRGSFGSAAPSQRVALGFIGVGNMGTGHVRTFLGHNDVQVLAACDVRRSHADRAKEIVDTHYGNRACTAYGDYRELLAREDLDAVVIAVPDHWHVPVGIEAARQGKDMYYEKPLGRTVAECQALREAVKRYGVVFQFGTQQRSSRDFRFACELARNHRIGKLQTIMIAAPRSGRVVHHETQPVPEGFDYDMWLGPAPWKPYTYERCTRDWTLIADYSLGSIGGAWGVHHVDIAQWANGSDHTAPVEVKGWGRFPTEGLYDTALNWEVELRWANGVKLIHMDGASARARAEQFKLSPMGVLLLGTEGWVYVTRRRFFSEPASLRSAAFGPNDIRLPRSDDHRRNFLDAVKTRRKPITDVETAVQSDIICHQTDIAARLGRRLQWDPLDEAFLDDDQANRMLSRAMRSPWRLE